MDANAIGAIVAGLTTIAGMICGASVMIGRWPWSRP